MVIFKDFSMHLSVFQVLFKANLIFKDFSRQSCIFKYFSSLSEPWNSLGFFRNYNLWPLNIYNGPSWLYCIKQIENSIGLLQGSFKFATMNNISTSTMPVSILPFRSYENSEAKWWSSQDDISRIELGKLFQCLLSHSNTYPSVPIRVLRPRGEARMISAE